MCQLAHYSCWTSDCDGKSYWWMRRVIQAALAFHLLPSSGTHGSRSGCTARAPGDARLQKALSWLASSQSNCLPLYRSGLFSFVYPGAMCGMISEVHRVTHWADCNTWATKLLYTILYGGLVMCETCQTFVSRAWCHCFLSARARW